MPLTPQQQLINYQKHVDLLDNFASQDHNVRKTSREIFKTVLTCNECGHWLHLKFDVSNGEVKIEGNLTMQPCYEQPTH